MRFATIGPLAQLTHQLRLGPLQGPLQGPSSPCIIGTKKQPNREEESYSPCETNNRGEGNCFRRIDVARPCQPNRMPLLCSVWSTTLRN